MPISSLDTDLRQFFSYSVLSRLDRLEDAGVNFTFEAGPLYLTCFAEAMRLIDPTEFRESDPALLRYAQVFERFASLRVPGISRRSACRTAATMYWLAGYSANATVLARALMHRGGGSRTLRGTLALILARSGQMVAALTTPQAEDDDRPTARLVRDLARYLVRGETEAWEGAELNRAEATRRAEARGHAGEFVAGTLLRAVLHRLRTTSLWGSVGNSASAPIAAWQQYAAAQVRLSAPLIDLWPSQRTAIAKGLLDSHSSLVLKMPTSAGKTKMTELAFVNDLFTDDRRCLYLAPFRALVSEIESSLGPSLADLGIAVASLYGGAESNEVEVELSQRARVVIATPEKIAAVLRMGGGRLTDFGTIVLDEGHLLGAKNRGTAYELQLADLRAEIIARTDGGVAAPRVIFLSAVLPNAPTIAAWLGGSLEALADNDWHPTTLRVGVLTWPNNSAARLRFSQQPNQPAELAFFVHRVLEEDTWQERHPGTGRLRSHKFPKRTEKADIAAALAFRYAAQGPVIVYAQQPRWADGVAERILARVALERPIETNLVSEANEVALNELAAYVARRMGNEAVVARALRVGVAVHHGGVPITIRLAIEHAFRSQVVRLLVATNTISQGVNFPVKTVVLHSLPRGDAPHREFWNLAGRAGRAMRETDGEVVLLQTGETKAATIRSFLDRGRMEPARSQILQFVEEILSRYPMVTQAAVDAVVQGDVNAGGEQAWAGVVASIDTHLLTLMAEDLADVEEAAIETLVANLLATQEAAGPRAQPRREGIATVFELRRLAIRALVPEAADRRRYARTGVSAAGAIALDLQLAAVDTLLNESPEMTPEALQALIEAACAAPELAGVSASQATMIAWAWMQRGSYADVLASVPGRFDSIDEAVKYVEQTISYALPWVLNGLLRLLDPEKEAEDPMVIRFPKPAWASYLPQFLRYGVNEPDLVWIMSLGIPDPTFAAWIREQFEEARGRRPESFRDVLGWAVDNQRALAEAASEWPRYFVRLLLDVLSRYAQVRTLLDGA